MSLYDRVRPTDFDGIVGNEAVVRNLRALVAKDEPPHAVLLTGVSGCGKTTLGRIWARGLGVAVPSEDFAEIDSADFRGIDTIRDIRRGAQFVAIRGKRRCWLIDEINRMPSLSQDALLKGLESPPPHAYFVLCTTNPENLLETIRSRCSIHKVEPLAERDTVRLLHRIAASEGAQLSRVQLRMIHEKTEGKPRAAIQLLEKVLASDEDGRDAILAEAEAVREKVDSLARELMKRSGWKAVARILSEVKDDDVESVRRSLIGYASKVLLGGEDGRAAAILDEMVEPFFNSGRAGLVHACYIICNREEG